MLNWWAVILVAAMGGVAVTLQGQFMGMLSQRMGTLEAVFLTYGGGGVAIALVLFAMRGTQLSALASAPWYAYTTGLLGLVIVGAIGYTASRLGLVATFTVMLASQFLLAVALDHVGWLGAFHRPLDWSRGIGILVMLTGVWLTLR